MQGGTGKHIDSDPHSACAERPFQAQVVMRDQREGDGRRPTSQKKGTATEDSGSEPAPQEKATKADTADVEGAGEVDLRRDVEAVPAQLRDPAAELGDLARLGRRRRADDAARRQGDGAVGAIIC